MFTRLKQSVFPDPVPHRMGLKDYRMYQRCGLKRGPAYLVSMQKHLESGAFDPVFNPVTHAILEDGVTIEQEIML